MKDNNKAIYQCPECGLHYQNQEVAKKCEVWCREHKSRNLELIKYAAESKQTEA